MEIHTLAEDRWTWVAEEGGTLFASITASPLHNGMVFIERIELNKPSATAGLRVFKEFKDECFLRGYSSFITAMSPSRERERKLMSVMRKRHGIHFSTIPFVMASGPTVGRFTGDEAAQLEALFVQGGYIS